MQRPDVRQSAHDPGAIWKYLRLSPKIMEQRKAKAKKHFAWLSTFLNASPPHKLLEPFQCSWP